MPITSLSISNYKCFEAIQNIPFSEGFNVILGKNNVGKSALLKAICDEPKYEPYKSIDEDIKRFSYRPTIFEKEYVFSSGDVKSTIFSSNQPKFLFTHNLSDYSKRFKESLNNSEFRFKAKKIVKTINSGSAITFSNDAEVAFLRAGNTGNSGTPVSLQMKEDMSDFYFQGGNQGSNLFNLVLGRKKKTFFLFDAERLGIAEYPVQDNLKLNRNADNLPSCLHYLKSTHERKFNKLRDHIHDLFPNISNLLTVPIENQTVKIFVSSLPLDEDVEHMRIPLNDCGTGVSQALAILFVVLTYEEPMTIVIDEPNSFLHPAASKKLIRILKEYPQHQYIVSTHSAEVFRAADPDNTLLVTYEDSKSKVTILEKDNLDDVRSALAELGTNMSDIFAADNILWVEGKTEEDCFREIARSIDDFPYGTSIVSVVNTGDFEQKSGKQASLIIDVYERLSKGDALIPASIGFIFDRECKTDKDIEDLTRRFGNKVEFLEYRMFENYLLDSAAIAHALNKLNSFKEFPIEEEKVSEWIENNHKDISYYKEKPNKDWKIKIDGAKLLEDLFIALSDSKETFHKTRDNLVMTKYLLENKDGYFSSIVDQIHALLDKSETVGTNSETLAAE